MTSLPTLPIGSVWIVCTFQGSQENSGQYGVFHRIYVEHEGSQFQFPLSHQQYSGNHAEFGMVFWDQVKPGEKIAVRKGEGKYDYVAWLHIPSTSADILKMYKL